MSVIKIAGPPNIIREFIHFEISFREGKKKVGDYLIYVNGIQVTDENIFRILCKKIKIPRNAINFLNFLWKIGKIKDRRDEAQVFKKITASILIMK